MQFKVAEIEDIADVLKLQYKYHINSIDDEDKKDGFITTAFSEMQLENLIGMERGLFIAKKDEMVVGYVMAASWEYWSVWPMFQYMIDHLSDCQYNAQNLTVKNSYQYGPICIDKSVRGSGVLEALFEFSRRHMFERYPILITFINIINTRSYHAHTKKLGLEVVQKFEYNNNYYTKLAYDTSKPIQNMIHSLGVKHYGK